MNHVIFYLAVLVMGSTATFGPGLRVKVGYGSNIGTEYFFDMPRHQDQAIAMGWSQMDRPTSPLPTLVMYCPKEYKLCIMYDPVTGYLAAIQVALPLDEFTSATFDWFDQGFIPWTLQVNNETKYYMTKQMYLISEKTLKKSKEERLEAAKEGKIIQEDKIWPVGFHQKRVPVSTNITEIVKDGFTKQNCFPAMGTHYFYNMTTELECKADTLLNWFLLVESDQVIGIAFTVIGVLPQKNEETYYFEQPTKNITLSIIKYCPTCLADLLEDPTSTTMHIYFIDDPWNISC